MDSRGNLVLMWTSVLAALTSLKAAGGQARKERDSWKLNLLADCGEPRLLWINLVLFHSCVTLL